MDEQNALVVGNARLAADVSMENVARRCRYGRVWIKSAMLMALGDEEAMP